MVNGHCEAEPRLPRGLTIALLVLAALARIAAVWHWSGNLDDDRDVYRALALGVVEGRGYSSPGTTIPTAYRPPLYPLLLAATGGTQSTFAVAIVNVLLGTATVGMVLLIGRRLSLGSRATLLAGLLTAIDPLLLYYTSFPMTETLCTCLLTAWLWALLRMQTAVGRSQLLWAAAAGLLLGLTALCRPTVWACAVLLLAAWLLFQRTGRTSLAVSQSSESTTAPIRPSAIVLLVIAALLTVAPWAIRNWQVFGRPIVTTTHGGYTLLLGNNQAYYDEVVKQSLGVIWDGSHGPGQGAWAANLLKQTRDAGLSGELERDRWMSGQARRTIRTQPTTFLRACLRRFLHFWSIVPNVRSDASLPQFAVLAVGAYYGILFTTLACGFACIITGRVSRTRWIAPLLLVAGFAGVHLVYWSDARMRAPITPEIALVATCCIRRQHSSPDKP